MKTIFSSWLLMAFVYCCNAQIGEYYLKYDLDLAAVSFCNSDTCAEDLNLKEFNDRAFDKVIFNGDKESVKIQMKHFIDFMNENRMLKIRIVEFKDSRDLDKIDSLIEAFKYLSVLIINNCDRLDIFSVIEKVNELDKRYKSVDPWSIADKSQLKAAVKKDKKNFKARPDIFYLNSLVLKNQTLHELGPPNGALEKFNYLEELRIDSGKGDPQAFINSLIEHYIVQDTLYPYCSFFPSLRFLSFTNCKLDSLSDKLRVRKEMISVDLSNNCFRTVPSFLEKIADTESLLSINLSYNNLEELSTAFLDNICKRGRRRENGREDRFTKHKGKFRLYLFLDKNCLDENQLIKLANEKYIGRFNTITFQQNAIEPEELITLAEEIETVGKIAQFMTGAKRYVNDYKPELDFRQEPRCSCEASEK